MSFLDGFLGGAAEAGAGLIASNIKNAQAQENARLESELALERQKTIEALKVKAADDARAAKSERIKGQLNTNADADVKANFQLPGDAPTVDGDGNPLTQEAIDSFKQGKGMIQSAMEKRKSDYLANPRNQLKAAVDTGDDDPSKLATLINDERRTASSDAANALKQRELDLKQVRDEAEAKSRDKVAQASLISADANLRRAIAYETKAEKAGGNITESERKTYTALMQDTTRQIQSARTSLKSIFDDAEKAEVQAQIKTLEATHQTYATLLAGSQSGGKAGADAAKGGNSGASRNGWDSGTGTVYKNGKPIGSAKSESEARSLYKQN